MTFEYPNLTPAIAELTLAVGAMVLLLVGVYGKKGQYATVSRLSLVLLLGALFYVLSDAATPRTVTFGGMFIQDKFAIFVKVLILSGSAVALLLSRRFMEDQAIARFEYPVLVILATLGMLLMVSAGSLLALYVGLELQSLSLYVLAAFNRDRARSTEAGLKYFILGALSSGMLLYGISLIYGFAGSIEFATLSQAFQAETPLNMGVVVGLMFVLAGLAFKISAVPFHMWAPDVYEGAPTPVTAFFAAAPKVAALALFVRVTYGAFAGLTDEWQQVVIFLSIASMLVGAFIALVQTNIKRLLAYSSIGHVGFALVGVAAGTEAGVEAMLIYLAIYLTMTLGTFGVVLTMRRGGLMVEEISGLSGLSKTNLPMAAAMAVFMFSLAGIPLLAGFFGKWFVFIAAVEAGLWPLAVIGVLASVVGAYYYLRIVKVMFFDEAEPAFDETGDTAVRAVVYTAALVNSPLSYILLIAPLVAAAGWAASGLLP